MLESEEELELEIKALENMRKESTDKSQELQSRQDLMLGVILGLLYGIIGGFFVQFIYPVIQSLIIMKYDTMFLPDAIFSVISFAMIIGTTITYKRRLDKIGQVKKKAKADAEVYDKILQKRKRQLEELRS